jgi:hypothetical protein
MGSRRCTLFSSGAAGVSLLLAEPTAEAESESAPQCPGGPEVEAIRATAREDDAESAHEPTRGPVPA